MPENFLILRSIDRVNLDDDPSLSVFELQQPLPFVSIIELKSMFMFRTHYNISANIKNNQIGYDKGGGLVTLVIPDGSYSFSTLMAYIGDQLLLDGIVFTGTIDNNYRCTLTTDVNVSFDFSVANSLYYDLGFDQIVTPSGLTSVGTRTIKFNTYHEIFIQFSGLQDNIDSSGKFNDIGAFSLMVTQNQGSLIEYYAEQKEVQKQKIPFQTLSNITVKLRGRNGILLENTADWTMKLAFVYRDNVA